MIPERHMKQARRVDNREMVVGFLFAMLYDTVITHCIGIEPLSANDYGEIYKHCYYEVDPATVEDVAVKPVKRYVDWFNSRQGTLDASELVKGKQYRDADACPNCFMELVSEYSELTAKCVMNHCPNCGQQIDWQESER